MPYADPAEARAFHRAKGQRYRTRNRALLIEFKSRPCTDCGNMFPPECMDFDHVRGTKLFTIARRSGMSVQLLKAEIAKCDLVCANCHRIRTYRRWREQHA